MRCIFKFDIDRYPGPVKIHKGAKIVSTAVQDGVDGEGGPRRFVKVWAECDTDAPLVDRKVGFIMTGYEEVPDATYIGLVMSNGIVAHVYDGGE